MNIQIYPEKTTCITHIVYKGRPMAGKVNHKGMRRGAMKNVEDVGSGSSADGPAVRISRYDAISDVVAPENWRTELAFNFKRRHRGRKGVRAALIDRSIYHLGRAGSALCEVARTSLPDGALCH